MNDERFDEILGHARDSYRVPPEPPVDEMWAAIEAEVWPAAAQPVPVRRSGLDWRIASAAAAAALVIGVGLGRWTAPPVVAGGVAPVRSAQDATARTVANAARPLQRTTTDYLGETAELLRRLQSQSDGKGAYAAQATTLLATTRLLLDSPAVSDQRLHDLLEDLELILAQIATLPNGATNARQREELQMIRSTLADRDVVPRVHTAVVTLASFDD